MRSSAELARPEQYDYCREDLAAALREVGLHEGALVFAQVGMGMLGAPREGLAISTLFQVVFGAFLDVLGDAGTLVVPTYTMSFCKGEDYDPDRSPSTAGPFAELFRQQPGTKRSLDPIMSVASRGPLSERLLKGLPNNCFGKDSVYDRLLRYGGMICAVGVGFRFINVVHHVETMVGVPYRYDKIFRGRIIQGGRSRPAEATYHVRALIANTEPALSEFERVARERKLCRVSAVGRGEVLAIGCEEYYRLCAMHIERDPWSLVQGPPCAIVPEG